MNRLRIRGGKVIGRQHVLTGKNCQDAYAIYNPVEDEGQLSHTLSAGVLSDGCGSSPTSEVGANLIVQRAISSAMESEVGRIWKKWSLHQVVEYVEKSVLEYLSNLPRGIWGGDFVVKNLLATVLGFVTDGEKIIIFSSGDGTIFIEDDVLQIDEDNRPSYLAYNLLGQKVGFKIIEVDLKETEKIALASDGFESELIDDFWSKEHPNGVQRLLNVYSKKKHFSDDATLITVEKIPEEGG